MQMVGRADVHDVDVRRLDELLRRDRTRARHRAPRRRAVARLGRRCGDADQACTREPRGPSVDSTDEPRPRDGDANLSSRHDRGSYRALSPRCQAKGSTVFWRVTRLNTHSILYFRRLTARSLVNSWTCSAKAYDPDAGAGRVLRLVRDGEPRRATNWRSRADFRAPRWPNASSRCWRLTCWKRPTGVASTGGRPPATLTSIAVPEFVLVADLDA